MRVSGKLVLSAVAFAALSSGAMAADLAMPAKAAAVVAPAPASSWDGAYIGGNVAYGWGEADASSTTPALAGYSSDISQTGFGVGGQLGYLFHLSDKFIGGVEGDISWSNVNGATTASSSTYTGITQTINWNGAVVAKLGLDMGQWMPYIDGGVAFANETRDATKSNAPITGTPNSETQTGWTAGVGLEAMLSDQISGFVEFDHADYGTAAYNTGGLYVPNVTSTDNTVKAGFNFHF